MMCRVSAFFFVILFLFSTIQCTSTRWTVADLHAVDEREEPEIIGSRYTVLVSDSATVNNPFLDLNLYKVEDREFTQRVLSERTVQQYKPKWGFTLLGSLGAAIAFYAGNTDGLIENRSQTQTVALNSAGILLTTMAFTNMRTAGEPIRTGETRYLRKSGTEVIPDTIRVGSSENIEVQIEISYNDEPVLSETYSSVWEQGVRINLASLLRDHAIIGHEPGQLDITLVQDQEERSISVPVSSIMRPVFVVEDPVAELRNEPVYDSQAPLAEIGSGSELFLIDKERSDRWFEVQFGGSNLFIASETGEIRWKAADIITDPTVVTVEEAPFGSISVEYSVPILKPANESDMAFLISNHRNNQIGMRRYMDRDFRLMELYFRDAFGVSSSRIQTVDLHETPSLNSLLENIRYDASGTLFAYVGGFASIHTEGDENSIKMIHIDEDGEETNVDLKRILNELASAIPAKMIVFLDLDFQHHGNSNLPSGNNGTSLYREISNSVTAMNENTALIFSSRPDQKSGIFESVRFEQKYHHIFPYYIAQALQQRRTVLSNLVRYIENQVDYTSRRLHDRPQTVQAFGNLSINLTE